MNVLYLHYPDILEKVSPTTLLYSKTLLMASTKHNYLKYKIEIDIGSKNEKFFDIKFAISEEVCGVLFLLYQI